GADGTISIFTTQPTTSDGKPIVYSSNGNITSKNTFAPSGVVENASISLLGDVITSGTNLTVVAGNSIAMNAAANPVIQSSASGTNTNAGNILLTAIVGDITGHKTALIASANGKGSRANVAVTGDGNIVLDKIIGSNTNINIGTGGNVALVASKNISLNEVRTASGQTAGSVTIVSGAAFPQTANALTVTGPSST